MAMSLLPVTTRKAVVGRNFHCSIHFLDTVLPITTSAKVHAKTRSPTKRLKRSITNLTSMKGFQQGGVIVMREENVALVENSYLDIHYDSNQKVVVGI
jgi:hypothetical protein